MQKYIKNVSPDILYFPMKWYCIYRFSGEFRSMLDDSDVKRVEHIVKLSHDFYSSTNNKAGISSMYCRGVYLENESFLLDKVMRDLLPEYSLLKNPVKDRIAYICAINAHDGFVEEDKIKDYVVKEVEQYKHIDSNHLGIHDAILCLIHIDCLESLVFKLIRRSI